jgi:thymidine kinase
MAQTPTIIVYSGPMFAGKSTKLIQSYLTSSVPDVNKVVFKYAKDIRYSNNAEIVTHNRETIPCVMVNTCADIDVYINTYVTTTNNRIDEIYIDECQFLKDIYIWINIVKTEQTPYSKIVLAGLDLDAKGNYFTDAFNTVINTADVNYSLMAKCYVCSENAQFTKLLKTEDLEKMDTNILIGGAELYQPACKTHFQA